MTSCDTAHRTEPEKTRAHVNRQSFAIHTYYLRRDTQTQQLRNIIIMVRAKQCASAPVIRDTPMHCTALLYVTMQERVVCENANQFCSFFISFMFEIIIYLCTFCVCVCVCLGRELRRFLEAFGSGWLPSGMFWLSSVITHIWSDLCLACGQQLPHVLPPIEKRTIVARPTYQLPNIDHILLDTDTKLTE